MLFSPPTVIKEVKCVCSLPCFHSPHIHLDPHFGAVVLQDVVLARRDQHPVGPLAAVRRRQDPFRICVSCNDKASGSAHVLGDIIILS